MNWGKRWRLFSEANRFCIRNGRSTADCHHHRRRPRCYCLIPRRFQHASATDPPTPATSTSLLSRDFLARLWVAEAKISNYKKDRQQKAVKCLNRGNAAYKHHFFHNLIGKWSEDAASAASRETLLHTQSPFILPGSVSLGEARVAPLLARSNLLITRDIEWENLVLGFEQENRYAIVDVCYPKSPIGLIWEQSNLIARQGALKVPIASPRFTYEPCTPQVKIIIWKRWFTKSGLRRTKDDLVFRQQQLELKTNNQSTEPDAFLHRFLTSGVDPDVSLKYFTSSQKDPTFYHLYSLELTFRLLHSLAHSKKYPKIRSFLDNFTKNDNSASVSLVLNAVLVSGDSFCVSCILVDMLVWAYVKNKKTHLGFEAFKRAGDYGLKISTFPCNQLLSALVKEGEVGDMEFVYKEMIKRRIQCNVISFNTVINGLCKIGKLNKASDVVEDMQMFGVSPNVVSYNTLIDGNCKMGKVGKMYKADAILKNMMARGICPNVVTFNILIDGFCKDNNMTAALKRFAEMQRQGLKPNVVTYNALINGLCCDDKVDEATELWYQMSGFGLIGNVVTYNALINGLCKKKMVGKAIDLFNHMEKEGVAPNVITYNTLIDAHCKDGRIEDAFALRDLMLVKGVIPNVSTYNCLIAGLCRKGGMELARNLMNEMTSVDLRADIVTYNILINILCSKGESRKAAGLLDEMCKNGLNPSHVTYNTLMEGYCNEGNIRAALTLRMRMEKNGRRANVVTYNVLIKGFCKKGKLKDANELLNDMFEKGLVPNQTTYEIVKEEMLENGFVPDIEGHLYSVSGSNNTCQGNLYG